MLPTFPHAENPFSTAESLAELGIVLRQARSDDIPWLMELYRESREEELAPIPWSDDAKRSFLDSQFELQHRHFLSMFPAGRFSIIESAGQPVGRLYLSNEDPELVADICIAQRARNKGFGSRLLQAVIDAAKVRRVNVELHVLPRNASAIRLYERLGFAFAQDQGSHLLMRRTVD